MRFLFYMFLFLVISPAIGQQKLVRSKILAVECDEALNTKRLLTRITHEEIKKASRILEFTTVASCCVDFNITSHLENKLVHLKLEETGEACDCRCGYRFKVELMETLAPDIKFQLNNKVLEKKELQYLPYEKRYFIFENDTTGFDDENGLRQGLVVFKRKNGLLKQYYRDGKLLKYELTDASGNVVAKGTDMDELLDLQKN
ncbi:hypothetical protein WIW50_04930 [Flavobacteriaceae bacterium 3-367]|uniref:hypothetical protein n=1 Tax=Eudoraea algarum TaxID=3417568 RepID=UPI00328B7807